MARSVDDVKAVPGKTGAARSNCARAGFDAVRYRAALKRFCFRSASKMAAAIRGRCADSPAETAFSADCAVLRRPAARYAVGGRRLRRACERTIDPARCMRRLVVARKARLRTILTSIAAPVLISVYDELTRRSLP